jgi:hypothetical protein
MQTTCQFIETILFHFAPAFTQPTFWRINELFAGAVLCRGRQTITRLIAALGGLHRGHISDYHRVLSRAPWKYHYLFVALATLVLTLVPDEWVEAVFDDTGTHHKGDEVFGKGCHRDAVNSSHNHTTFYYGHKWVALCILVKFPWFKRRLALPILSLLYIPPKAVTKMAEDGIIVKYRTMPELAKIMIWYLASRFPGRKFRFLADGGYSSQEIAGFCAKKKGRVSLVGKFYSEANLYEKACKESKAMKGAKMPKPSERIQSGNYRHASVRWYNATSRKIKFKSGTGLWYRAGQGVVEVRWVFVKDMEGNHRDEYFFTTDMSMSEVEIIESYTGRWNIETTFQECKEHLGLDSTRNWCESSVRRSVPCLLALYTVVALVFHEFWKENPENWRSRMNAELGYCGYVKADITFSDVLSHVRRMVFVQILLNTLPKDRVSRFINSDIGKFVLAQLAQSP